MDSFDYEGSKSGESLFSLWENGRPAPLPAPLSVRRPRYRRVIVKLAQQYALRLPCRILSLGAGNGFTEAALSAAGFDVVASDKSRTALSFCAKKGLRTALYDLSTHPPDELLGFDMLYCDGLLGHLWKERTRCAESWTRLAECGTPNAILIVSNDLADTDDAPTFRVTGDPAAKFFRPPAGWFANDATAVGLWDCKAKRMLNYMRRGPRRREILVLERLLMHEGKV